MFCVSCIVIQLYNVNQQNAHALKLMFQFNSSCLLRVSNITCSSSGRTFVHAVFIWYVFLAGIRIKSYIKYVYIKRVVSENIDTNIKYGRF